MIDHTRTEKIGDDSILFLWSSKSSGKPLRQTIYNKTRGLIDAIGGLSRDIAIAKYKANYPNIDRLVLYFAI